MRPLGALREKGYNDVAVHTDLLCGSGGLVIRNATVMDTAHMVHRKLGAYEMEALGVANSCLNRDKPLPFLILKSISDFGEDKSDEDPQIYEKQRQMCLDIISESIVHCFLKSLVEPEGDLPA